jgi:hypothetical protein
VWANGWQHTCGRQITPRFLLMLVRRGHGPKRTAIDGREVIRHFRIHTTPLPAARRPCVPTISNEIQAFVATGFR